MRDTTGTSTAEADPVTTSRPSAVNRSRRHQREVRALTTAVALYGVVFAAKLTVYFATGLMALLAEALHTLSDIFISGFLLLALLYSRKQADEDHMFGHGRAQNVAGLVAAVLFVSVTAYRLYEEAISRLLKPAATGYGNFWLALGVLAGSMLIAAFPAWSLIRSPERGAAARAQLRELLNDELGLASALIATLLVMAGWPIADPIASIAVATIITMNAIGLLRPNLSMLLGKALSREFLDGIRKAALAVPGVVAVRGVLAEVVGPASVHAGLRLAAQPDMPVKDAHQISVEVKKRVHEESDAGYCVIEMEPALPTDPARIVTRATSAAPAPGSQGDDRHVRQRGAVPPSQAGQG